MTFSNWAIYFLAVLVLTASPGPSVLLCVSKSVSYGIRNAIVAALGSVSAMVIIMTLSFTGLGLVIATSNTAFSIIKWGGAAYLVYMGIRVFFSTVDSMVHATQERRAKDILGHWFSGFIVGASNPKAIVFFTALFPQFIDLNSALMPQYLVLVSTFVALELFWLTCYSALAHRSSAWLAMPGRAKRFNQLTGGVFVGAGLLLSTSSRAATV
ncbi:MAG: LysE family translocator [Granulosicoccus sp.]